MLNATRCVKAAISPLLFFAVSGYALSVVNWDTAVNKGSPPFALVIQATSGQEMYTTYCTECHGENGRGFGPNWSECTVPPADLTQLARKNHGIYPSERVCQVLRHGTGRRPAGQGDMRIWEPLLRLLNADPPGVTEVRIRSLSEYVWTSQEKPTAPSKWPEPIK